eukprot:3739510-Pyramimonas_sp.AAC.1
MRRSVSKVSLQGGAHQGPVRSVYCCSVYNMVYKQKEQFPTVVYLRREPIARPSQRRALVATWKRWEHRRALLGGGGGKSHQMTTTPPSTPIWLRLEGPDDTEPPPSKWGDYCVIL